MDTKSLAHLVRRKDGKVVGEGGGSGGSGEVGFQKKEEFTGFM
jgi:hypothetical protein